MEVDGDRQRQSKGRGPETQEGECHERGAIRNEPTGWETEALRGQDSTHQGQAHRHKQFRQGSQPSGCQDNICLGTNPENNSPKTQSRAGAAYILT